MTIPSLSGLGSDHHSRSGRLSPTKVSRKLFRKPRPSPRERGEEGPGTEGRPQESRRRLVGGSSREGGRIDAVSESRDRLLPCIGVKGRIDPAARRRGEVG